MNNSDPESLPFAEDEILVYVGELEIEPEEPDAFERHTRRETSVERGLARVTVTDDELDRLRKQVQRIASKLEPDIGTAQDGRFAVGEVTLHVGLSASGQFFFIASAGVEAAIDITWRRPS